MKVSVIIPVYNVEKFLPQCIDSILSQTHKDIEIILVNDGSTDNSPHICTLYAEKYNSIKVIHKTNGGLSSARNAGIRAVKGDLICFLDSDDYWIDNRALENICSIMNLHQLDCLEFGAAKCDESGSTVYSPDYIGRPSMSDFLPLLGDKIKHCTLLLSKGALISSACNKVIRSELFIKSNLYFREGIISEDVDWVARLIIAGERFGVYNQTVMIYRQRYGSITHSHHLCSIKQAADNLLYINTNFDDYLSRCYLAIAFSNFLIAASSLPIKDIVTIASHVEIHKYHHLPCVTNRAIIFSRLCKFLGLKQTIIIIKSIHLTLQTFRYFQNKGKTSQNLI